MFSISITIITTPTTNTIIHTVTTHTIYTHIIYNFSGGLSNIQENKSTILVLYLFISYY